VLLTPALSCSPSLSVILALLAVRKMSIAARNAGKARNAKNVRQPSEGARAPASAGAAASPRFAPISCVPKALPRRSLKAIAMNESEKGWVEAQKYAEKREE